MLEHEGVHQHRWCQDTPGSRSMTASTRLPPGGILDPLAGEEVGKTLQIQPYCVGLLGMSGVSVWRLETSSPNSPLPLLRWLFGAVPERFPVIIRIQLHCSVP